MTDSSTPLSRAGRAAETALFERITQPLRIAVVGHTNTGKTSLLRTLTRDARFGDVSARPGTTRHVESARLLVRGRVLLELYDTPGLEDAIDLLALVDHQSHLRDDGPTRVQRFLASPEAGERFEQEAKVLRQVTRSDAALYVIDARDPVLAKHRDELALLALCGVPLLPLLNFVAGQQTRESEWRDALAGIGLHAIVRFDTVAPASDGERLLYTKMATLLDAHSDVLNALILSHEEDTRQRHESALELIADLLIDIAALRRRVSRLDKATLAKGIEQINQQVRQREQLCVERLLSLYRFYPDDVEPGELPLVDGRWEQDLFDPYTLQAMGIRLGGGAAAGAAAGLGVDLMVGGVTLGAAAAVGALLGGGLQAIRHYGSELFGKLTGEKSLRIDDAILQALLARQYHLLRALQQRGHAASEKLALSTRQSDTLFAGPTLPAPLRRARANPGWFQPDPGGLEDAGRRQAVQELAARLATVLAAAQHSHGDSARHSRSGPPTSETAP